MSAHTPGPWKITGRVITGSDGASVDFAPHHHVNDGHGPRANADKALISAAPELLAALKKAREAVAYSPPSFAYDMTHLPMIDAAIAKAEGRS